MNPFGRTFPDPLHGLPSSLTVGPVLLTLPLPLADGRYQRWEEGEIRERPSRPSVTPLSAPLSLFLVTLFLILILGNANKEKDMTPNERTRYQRTEGTLRKSLIPFTVVGNSLAIDGASYLSPSVSSYWYFGDFLCGRIWKKPKGKVKHQVTKGSDWWEKEGSDWRCLVVPLDKGPERWERRLGLGTTTVKDEGPWPYLSSLSMVLRCLSLSSLGPSFTDLPLSVNQSLHQWRMVARQIRAKEGVATVMEGGSSSRVLRWLWFLSFYLVAWNPRTIMNHIHWSISGPSLLIPLLTSELSLRTTNKERLVEILLSGL